MDAIRTERPINKKCCVGVFLRLTANFDRFVTNDRDAIRCRVRLKQRFQIWRRFNHHKFCKRISPVYERVSATWKGLGHRGSLRLSHHFRFGVGVATAKGYELSVRATKASVVHP
jgi:hypothetical protein